MTTLQARRKHASSNGWEDRHNLAVTEAAGFAIARTGTKAAEAPIVRMLTAWQEYALAHQARFESAIGEDYVLGPAWQQIGESIRTLLNGELGRLDGGTLDGFILNTMSENGIDTSQL